MNLTPYQKKQLRFVLILILGIPATIFAVYQGVRLIIKAGADATPKEVVVSNLTTNSLTITWVTEKEVEGYVVPVLNGTEQSPVKDKRGDGKRTSHYVELKSLEPSTEYSFILLSDGDKYNSGQGGQYKFSTAPVGEDTPVPNPVYGSVEGGDADNVMVYVMFKDKSVYPVSTDVPTNGNWIVELSSMRSVSNKSMVKTTSDTQLVVMARDGVNKGAVLQGAYSTLFNSSGQLNQNLALEDMELNELLAYFPNEAILGTSTPQEPEEPKPPKEPEEPVVPIKPTTQYTPRQDVVWENITTENTTPNLLSGEDTIVISNLTDTNFVISWRSSEKEEGYCKYGISKTEINNEMRDSRDSITTRGKYYSHYIESPRLEPDTTYYFEVYSGTKVYDNDGVKYSLKTLSTLSSPPPLETRAGKVINASDPSDWVLIFRIMDNDELGTSGSSGDISVLPDVNGKWVLVMGDARSEDGSSYFSFSNSDILQAYFLGADSKKYDFNLSQNDIELDVSKIGSGTTSKVNYYPIMEY
jgi:hypothetical protein